MSRWGLTHKGVEVITPAEWNAVIDALEELDKRSPVEWNGGFISWDGDGVTTEFLIPHGLSLKPYIVFVTPASPDAKDIQYVYADDKYIHVVFSSPPPSGESNVSVYWIAIRK